MSRKKVYGRAYPITQADVKAYRRVERSLKSNPIGVTSMSSVNGRGSARSARQAMQGMSRSQRIARAERVYRNGEQSMKTSRKKTTTPNRRTRVSGTNYFRVKGGRYQDAKGKFVPASRVKKRTSAKKKTTTKRKVRRNASVGYSPSYGAGYDRMQRSKARTKKKATKKTRRTSAAKAAAPKRRRAATSKKTTTRKRRTTAAAAPKRAAGKRTSLKQRRTGRRLAAYSAALRGGASKKKASAVALRAVPLQRGEQFMGKAKAPVTARKAGTAVRRNKKGSSLVANGKKKVSAKQRRAGRRVAAYSAARRSGKSQKAAKRAAFRKEPLRRGDAFKGVAKAPVKTRRKNVKVRRNKKRRTTAKATKTTIRKNRRRTKPVKANRRRTTKAVKTNRRRTKAKRRRSPVKANRRRRSVKRNGWGSYRKNAFMANLKNVLRTGAFVTGGFLAHKVITNLICDHALASVLADNPTFQDWKKPLCGLGVLALGIPVAGAVAKKNAIEIGAGMAASFLQTVIVTALNAAGQGTAASALSGYSESRAYALRGVRKRRRGLRGGMERHAVSIGPRYTPVGQFQQAAAGQWQQAAAGQYQQAAAGEYYTANRGAGEYFTATGEYFAPPGLQGVGAYEPAGKLAMQATAGTHQNIDDGISPDSDLDHVLDVAEAAAGLHGAEAQYKRVPRESQWIPNNPLFAGERAVTDTQAKSQLPAGILQRPGGNGILSG